mgnify:CR=1 FL=1
MLWKLDNIRNTLNVAQNNLQNISDVLNKSKTGLYDSSADTIDERARNDNYLWSDMEKIHESVLETNKVLLNLINLLRDMYDA